MDYYSDAKRISNVSVVDIFLIDKIAETIDYGDKVTPRIIIDLARLIEAFVLNNEVVIRDHDVIYDGNQIDFDFQFTGQWIKTFFDSYVVRDDRDSAATLLSNDFCNFYSLNNKINRIYSTCEEDDDYRRLEDFEISTITWGNMARYYGIPFISPDWVRATKDSRRVTNISMDLYNQMEKYYATYFEKIAKYLGPTYIRIPTLLSLVLKESRSIEEIPVITAQIKDRFSEFVLNTTTLEFQLRTADTIIEQIEIIKEIENCYTNIVKRRESSKKRIQSRVFDIAQSLDIKTMISESIKEFREWNVEENGLLLIPGYYNMWEASEEVKQSLPLLKRLFGSQIDADFLLDLHRLNLNL